MRNLLLSIVVFFGLVSISEAQEFSVPPTDYWIAGLSQVQVACVEQTEFPIEDCLRDGYRALRDILVENDVLGYWENVLTQCPQIQACSGLEDEIEDYIESVEDILDVLDWLLSQLPPP